LLQNFVSIDTQTFGDFEAYPIPYFDDGPAKDGLHTGGTCHDQGGVMTHPNCAKCSAEEAVVT